MLSELCLAFHAGRLRESEQPPFMELTNASADAVADVGTQFHLSPKPLNNLPRIWQEPCFIQHQNRTITSGTRGDQDLQKDADASLVWGSGLKGAKHEKN